jgi:predicted nucleotidyltransferase component of viral defense system
MVFIGGTALRKLHGLPRFSEDIDFVCDAQVDYQILSKSIVSFFHKIGFDQVDFSIQQGSLINRLTLKFAILKAVGLSPLESEKLHIKVETTVGKLLDIVRVPKSFGNFSSVVISYPLETMMSSKIAACLTRVYKKGNTKTKIKGRDYFDLIWYLEKKIVPDTRVFDQLDMPDLSSVIAQLDEKVTTFGADDLLVDLKTYVEDRDHITHWCKNFHEMYASASQYLRHQ